MIFVEVLPRDACDVLDFIPNALIKYNIRNGYCKIPISDFYNSDIF